jgi:type II secretory pathway pseudopilin PulG
MTLAGLVASSVLLAAYAGLNRATETYETMVAMGIAEQIMDEITGQPYCEKGQSPYQWPLGPETNDGKPAQPGARNHFDDLDDYAGYSVTGPITDRWGYPLGVGDGAGGQRDPTFRLPTSFFKYWSVAINVAYVPPDSWDKEYSDATTSNYRAVTVVVRKQTSGNTRELARVRRVVGYIPSS